MPKRSKPQPPNGLAPKASEPSSVPPGTLVRQAHGGALRRGNPGNRGREADKFKATMLQLINDPKHHESLKRILKGEDTEILKDPATGVPVMLAVDGDLYLKAMDYAAKWVIAKPPQDITSGGEPLQATWMLINGIEVEF